MARSDEYRAALASIGAFLAFGAAFVLLGLVTPAITPRFHAICWETAMVGLFAAAATVWRHPVVWFPLVRYWYSRLRQKPKPAPAPGY
ncbi:unnamed protein product [Urochloa decumbens]|uniref:Uncharacterized protein n=1 Tax=Urochloa decumbens TaxID=240449 RepID=A0ABC9G392_9POAL